MSALAPIFQPFTLRKLVLRNRVIMAPMTRSFCPDGIPGADVAAYYRRRAEGEVGLIVTEGVGIDHLASLGDSGLGDNDQPILHGEAALKGWKRVVDEVHAAGGLIAPQLWHQGPLRLHGTGPHPQVPSSRPSGLWGPDSGVTSIAPDVVQRARVPSQPMTESEIADVVAAYGRSAANAKALGFDAIAIHGAHGYMIDAFLWTGTNKRVDRWGGELRNRTRFGVEVLREIRRAIGDKIPIMFRFSQWKQADFNAKIAASPAELECILGAFADAGVDAFDASTRRYHDVAFPEFDTQLGLAAWAQKLTGKPSMAVGSIGLQRELYYSFGQGGSAASDNIIDVVQRVARGEFDLVGVGRALIADPAWPRKMRCAKPAEPFSMATMGRLV
ncbi:NADH:flavin oxidoreductase/NADH oxidase [Burkholderia sp. H160]|nr:NADH:flavin oxidoreductase/NADH oxidase [Burkholderia sp. H160]